MVASTQSQTLQEFLSQTETQPAGEFLNGFIDQKAIPEEEHSVIQANLCALINRLGKPSKIACAFPELHCIFADSAIVPDITAFNWEQIPRNESGSTANRFELAPDWVIEILSPDPSSTQVLAKIAHCLEQGTQLGWLIDPKEESVSIMLNNDPLRGFARDQFCRACQASIYF